jgi:hypothetical protein
MKKFFVASLFMIGIFLSCQKDERITKVSIQHTEGGTLEVVKNGHESVPMNYEVDEFVTETDYLDIKANPDPGHYAQYFIVNSNPMTVVGDSLGTSHGCDCNCQSILVIFAEGSPKGKPSKTLRFFAR